MRLHIIKAGEGDSLLLETGDAAPRRLLIDGGPHGCWERDLRPYLEAVLGADGAIDVLAVSHVDNDHVIAPLDLLAEREKRRADTGTAWPPVGEIWHNSFAATLDTPERPLTKAVQNVVAMAGLANVTATASNWVLTGISEGAKLRRGALRERIKLNAAFGSELLSPDAVADPIFNLGATSIRLVGPTRANLDALRDKWLAWARDVARAHKASDLANVDKSVPNLSSIIFLAEENGRRILFTGDARGDHIEQGLHQADLLTGGRLHVDVLKVQHHASKRNAEPGFFARITADTYVVSANGRYGNPDLETLQWIVEAAKSQGRTIKILATHPTPSIDALRTAFPPADHGYSLRLPGDAEHALAIELS